MREIKFRARTFDGEWLEGSLVQMYSDGMAHIAYERQVFDPVTLGFVDTEWREDEVKPETVIQYTGLKDKNGVEIYEGDMCLYDGLPGAKNGLPIVWANGGFFLQGRMATDTKMLSQTTPSRDLEVIGNIYENPELLQGSEL